MSDIFAKLNDLNLSLSMKKIATYLLQTIKLKVLLKRSAFGKVGSKKIRSKCFLVSTVLQLRKFIVKLLLKKTIIDHLKALEIQFRIIFCIKYWFTKNSLDSKAVLDWLQVRLMICRLKLKKNLLSFRVTQT